MSVPEFKYRRVVVWMRRAWRVQDNPPLWHALRDAREVVPVVCLSDDPRYHDPSPRRRFLRSALKDLDAGLRSLGSRLTVRRGAPLEEIPAVAAAYGADAVYATDLYDPASRERDARLSARLGKEGRKFVTFKGAVAFDGSEVLTAEGKPYRVFTPYKNAWLRKEPDLARPLPQIESIKTPAPRGGDIALDRFPGFSGAAPDGGESAARLRLKRFLASGILTYAGNRNLPAIDGTSLLSPHLSLGTISVNTVIAKVLQKRRGADRNARENIETYLNELIWREFFGQILFHFPHVTGGSFRPEFDGIPWNSNQRQFTAWCEGRTGYPIVDAGMRQLNSEGWMHNRVRMIVASFLTKDLHIHWQMGERYFFDRLIDADIASNNGGWQWTAGTGTDASPWFRIFNPVAQGQRFDPRGEYVRRYLPELVSVPDRHVHAPWLPARDRRGGGAAGLAPVSRYPAPIVDHDEERRITLDLYGNSVKRGGRNGSSATMGSGKARNARPGSGKTRHEEVSG